MNCDRFKNLILLADSGELEQSDVTKLNDHLMDCPSCRLFQRDLELIQRHSVVSDNDLKISDFTMQRIAQEAARTGKSSRHPALRLTVLYGIAALLLLVLGLRWLMPTDNALLAGTTSLNPAANIQWDDSWDQEFAELEESFIVAGLEIDDNNMVLYDEDSYDNETLAAELLAMEES